MTKEEQEAERIIEMFQPYNQDYIEGSDGFYEDQVEGARECALLHVNGKLKMLDNMYNGYYTMPSAVSDKVDFLESVKQIIESK